MDRLNLKYISMAELENVIEPMGMFGSNALFQVRSCAPVSLATSTVTCMQTPGRVIQIADPR